MITGHFSTYGNKQGSKLENCGGKTHVMREKCGIHLCFVVNTKNCLADFHKKKKIVLK